MQTDEDRALEQDVKVVAAALVLLAATLGGCVENQPSVTPNSDGGHLFIDLEAPVAVGWTSEVVIFGPATGGQHCEEGFGCYADHHPIQMGEVISSDESIVEVLGFEVQQYGAVDGIRVDLEAHQEGEVTLDFSFTVEGVESETDEAQEEDQEQIGGPVVDSYTVETREVAHMRLARETGHVNPLGPYGTCPERGEGAYLMDVPGEYDILVQMQKLDERGNLLRGFGQFPFEIEPEELVEVQMENESLHQVRLTPKDYGTMTITPEMGGDPFINHFVPVSDVQSLEARAYGLGGQGGRGSEVVQFSEGRFYEFVLAPVLNVPLCGGRMDVQVQTLTPVICEPAGQLQDRPNEAIAAHHAGDCLLRLTAPAAGGGEGLVQELVIPVQHDW